jgi:hypothetical protein
MAFDLEIEAKDYRLYDKTYELKITGELGGSLLAGVGLLDEYNITELDIDFDITRTITKEANSGRITVYNLSETMRNDLSAFDTAAVVLQAGYSGENRVIFAGDVRQINSVRDGTEWKTELKGGDGERKIKKKRIRHSVKGPVLLSAVIRDVANKLGLPLSRGSEILLADPTLSLEFANKQFTNSVAWGGKTADVLDKILASSGLEWSIQNGELQLLTRGAPISNVDEIFLRPDTGLLGSPKIGSDKVLSCASLMISDIAPGRTIDVKSKYVEGRYVVQKAKYKGSTIGADWTIDIEAKAI